MQNNAPNQTQTEKLYPAFYLLYRLEVPLTNEILINMSHSSESF